MLHSRSLDLPSSVAVLLAAALAVLSLALSAGPAPAAPTSGFVQREAPD